MAGKGDEKIITVQVSSTISAQGPAKYPLPSIGGGVAARRNHQGKVEVLIGETLTAAGEPIQPVRGPKP